MSFGERFDQAFARVESLMREWRLDEATTILESLEQEGAFPNRLRHDLSVIYAQQGLFAQAKAQIEAALEVEPSNRALWHHYLALLKNDPQQPTPSQWRAMHLAYGNTLRDRHDERHLAVSRDADPRRRLRVGYLCPDTHLATGRFIWPLLESFDGGAFEVFAYWCHASDLDRLRIAYPRVSHRSLVGLDEGAVVEAICADVVDIAVDIAGHGSGNVLPALARRPAPVAITWLDYLATTGLAEVDFRMTDAVADPEGSEDAHVERLLRLPSAQWCYRAPAWTPAPAPTSGAPRPPIRFGSVSVPLKLSDPVLALWARLLERVPESRLRFLGVPEGRARDRIRERLSGLGIDLARIEILPRLGEAQFYDELRLLDVVLDTYPFSGATSTLDALWAGVPVVTLRGPLSHGRSTASILTTLGRGEWVTNEAEQFLEVTSRLARDTARLALERTRLRADLRSSALCDGPAFARSMEGALREAWRMRRLAPVSPRVATASFWQGCRVAPAAPVPRIPITTLARTIDCASEDCLGALVEATTEWVLVTDSSLFDLATMADSIPAAAIASCDAIAALGADVLAAADVALAGAGHVRGCRVVRDGQDGRLYASAWEPRDFGSCVALSGGGLLARREWLAREWRLERPTGGASFRAEVLRVTHAMRRAGARLGVTVALAASERAWPDESEEHVARRAVEQSLGLPRWMQQRPAALPWNVVLTPHAWSAVRLGLERACDGPFGAFVGPR